MTNKELLDIVNYDSGMCLCGHFETCSVCTRSQATRNQEKRAKLLALETLRSRGIKLRKVPARGVYGRDTYMIVNKSKWL